MKSLNDVALLRVYAVLTLVAWHVYCPYICWGIAETSMSPTYTKVFQFLAPDTNMPLFTFISGYLFYYLLKVKKHYNIFKVFLHNKIHRLLIPFLILGSLTNILSYDKNIIDLFYGKPSHLWYCLMLFYCFLICYLVEAKLSSKINKLLMCLSFAGAFIMHSITTNGPLTVNSPLGIFLPMYYYSYFYFGFLVYKHKEKIVLIIKRYLLVIILLYIISCLYTRYLLPIAACSYILLLLTIMNNSFFIKLMNNPNWGNIIYHIGKYSFGIYVIHQYLLWNMTRIPFILSYIQPVMIKYDILFPLLLYVIIFLISMTLTKICIKTRIGKNLLT